jgi:putative flavoprotein involved in K+ transport
MASDTKHNSKAEDVTLIDLSKEFDVIVVGAGAAGIGVGITLENVGVENFLIVDRDTVGSSFTSWPDETRFITPSFPSNSIGMLDLNSIAIGISPAFSMKVEHPNGKEFADHLLDIAKYFDLPILQNTNVKNISKKKNTFTLECDEGTLLAKNLIWAAGEFQYPRLDGFVGSDLCRHTSTVPNYGNLDGDEIIIIGGYESGVDAAYHLAKCGKKVVLFDKDNPWNEDSSDPSVSLSTFSYERMRDRAFNENVELFPQTPIISVTRSGKTYNVKTVEGQIFKSQTQPLLASGFQGSHKFVSHLFDKREDGFPLLSKCDESTVTPGMFLCGPSVRHDHHDFCFIYKYRQRFAIVAQAIASSLDIPTEKFIETYKGWGMYLDDLSCCGQECLTC